LVAEETVDEAYYWSSVRKERRMHSILSTVRTKGVRTVKKKATLLDYT
jgi:ERCC4-related helicase